MAATTTQEEHSQRPTPLEDLTFHPSAATTLGVELELQVLDRESGALVPGALRILDACAEEKVTGVTGEFLQSMLEVKTGVCRDVAEVRDTLFPLLRRVRNIASSLGYDLALGGTHPFNQANASALFPDARYQRIHKRQGWLATQEAIFGLHVHVGVPGGDEAVGLINLLVQYLPHLLALSANSPFWQGIDSGFASARSAVFRPSAHAGLPQHFPSWEAFCRYCRVMHQAGALEATKDIYWDIRPRPAIGTIEFRVCDVPATLGQVLALVALTRCLVLHGLRRLGEKPRLAKGDLRRFWLARENKWRAARYGLQARCVRRPGGPSRTLADDTARLLEHLAPVALEAGEDSFLTAWQPLAQFESGALRQRRLYRQSGNWQGLIEDLKTRWVRELDEVPLPATPATTDAGPSRETPPAPEA